MRLLHATTQEFHEFVGTDIPAYAILSHRWEDEEVTYQEVKNELQKAKKKKGFEKVQQCCTHALKEGLDYVWVDTCCIDKSSSAELSEAINSMYQWYRLSTVCYAFLSDDSRWWTRGWTLQELIAPQIVKFFGSGLRNWIRIGGKRSLLSAVADRTGIDREILRGADPKVCSVSMRMSWASGRETSRPEDMAYSLIGIFGVNMPLLYGEGTKAFVRLQVWSSRRCSS
ncbi:HET-domain-containing protein [Setomelanomma holmii]|uniref:HET-domain-containing protein n=1 Tax=Setomelanomma holmii TaxID=210430 RepID=A0A9P4LIK4_9PLEO|nr:HET-domain-containing protein [Setomelanomma holmii]